MNESSPQPSDTASEFEFFLDGEPMRGTDGLTVAAALLVAGRRTLRESGGGAPRGLFCGMGACFDCVVDIDGQRGVRACVTLVRPGMRVETPRGAPGLGRS